MIQDTADHRLPLEFQHRPQTGKANRGGLGTPPPPPLEFQHVLQCFLYFVSRNLPSLYYNSLDSYYGGEFSVPWPLLRPHAEQVMQWSWAGDSL